MRTSFQSLSLGLAAGLVAIPHCSIGADGQMNARDGSQYTKPLPVNLSFTSGLIGWTKGVAQNVNQEFTAGIASHGRAPGHPCSVLSAAIANPSHTGYLVQGVQADRYRGHRIRFTAYLKTQRVSGAALWLRYDITNHNTPYTETPSGRIHGSTDWQRYTIVADIPRGARGFEFGDLLIGQGKVWMADTDIEIVNKSVPLTSPDAEIKYSGDTERVVHTWMLSRKGRWNEALDIERSIVGDPHATAEERVTAEEGIAFDSFVLGRSGDALNALMDFDRDRKGLAIDMGVVAEAERIKSRLQDEARSGYVNQSTGADWTDINKDPENLEFKAGTSGWDHVSSDGFVVTRKQGAGPRGEACAVLHLPESPPNGWASFHQGVRADYYRGKRIRFSAIIKTQSTSYAALGVRVDAQVVRSFNSRSIMGTRPWQRQELVFDAPRDTQGIIFGFALNGPKSSLWISGVKLEIVDKTVPLTAIQNH